MAALANNVLRIEVPPVFAGDPAVNADRDPEKPSRAGQAWTDYCGEFTPAAMWYRRG
jgi:hypothetical protein